MDMIFCIDCGAETERTGQYQKRCLICRPLATAARVNKRSARLRKEASQKGICMYSGCAKHATAGVHCADHAVINKKRSLIALSKRKALGMCMRCGRNKPVIGKTSCGQCLWAAYTSVVRHGARARKLPIMVSDKTLRRIAKMPCHYCGGVDARGFNGIDCKDHQRGYVRGNMLPCCWMHNAWKGRMLYKDFLAAILKAAKYLLKVKKRIKNLKKLA